MILNYLCPPALLYAVIMLIYLVLELSDKKYHQAFVKAIVGIIFTCILQAFCQMSLGVVSWIFVMIPIIFYTYITLLTFFVFGLNPDNKYFKFTSLKPSPSSVPAPVPAPVPALATDPAPATATDPNKWMASKHVSSTPITTTLYTPSVVPPGKSQPSPSYSSIIPAPSIPVPDSSISQSYSGPEPVIDESFMYPTICSMNDYDTCASYSVCSWTFVDGSGSCGPYYDYQNNTNNLFKKCNKLTEKECNNDKSCYLFDGRCGPSIIGIGDLFNKQDCINFNTNQYNNYTKSDPLNSKKNEEKDLAFLTNSFKEIDSKGCGYVSQNIMETLYPTSRR